MTHAVFTQVKPRSPAGAESATVPALVLAAALRRPAAAAVSQGDLRISYRELVRTAAGVAAALAAVGVGPEDRVVVCADRRPATVAAMLGVMLAGAAYAPLDPAQPADRLLRLCRRAAPAAVLVDSAGARALDGAPGPGGGAGGFGDVGGIGGIGDGDGDGDGDGIGGIGGGGDGIGGIGSIGARRLDLTGIQPLPVALEDIAPGPAGPDHAAYVIHTSGSTGEPKGVVVTQRAVAALAAATVEGFGLTEHDRTLAYASFGFDVSVLDLWVPLAVGASVQLAPEPDRTDPARLRRFLIGHRVTFGSLPPMLLPLLDPADYPEFRTLMTGDEAPPPEQLGRWSAGGRRFFNCYGPTETTVQVTAFEGAGEHLGPLPIGRALAGHRVHVVDEALDPVPPGTPGELLIGGPGLARGYLGAAGATADRFVPDPFGSRPGARLYRTGDRVVQDPDGTLTHLGRIDRQIKIRGQRVEPGEVETVLRAHPAVVQAAAFAVPAAGGYELLAAVASADTLSAADVRAWCADRLPTAFVPSRVVVLDRLPATASGKVDTARIAALERAEAESITATTTATATATELDLGAPDLLDIVRDLWCRALDVPRAAPDDDFFDAGGHSLTAMRLVAAIRERLGREVAVEEVFDARTPAGLAAVVAEAPDTAIEQISTGHAPALSAGQRRVWFIDQFAPDSAAYNITMSERILGPLDVSALGRALRAVTERHEPLRWRFPVVQGQPSVSVDPPADVRLPVQDLAGLPEAEQRALIDSALTDEARTRFDLATGPLWRARLLRVADDDHYLLMTVHHAVFDGWSQDLLYRDLGRIYAGAEPPVLRASFADYVAWRERGRGAADLAWWHEHLAGAPSHLDLPRDRPRPAEQTWRGARASARLPIGVHRGVRALSARLGTTPATILLTAFAELMSRVADRRDLVLGTPVSDRRHAAFEDLIGFFVDIVPLRMRLDAEADFATAVRECRGELQAALAHPGATLDELVRDLRLPRDPARGPLIQVLFNVFNFSQPRLELAGTRGEPVVPSLPGSLFDLTVYLVDEDDGCTVTFVYNPDLFDADRISKLISGYHQLLAAFTDDPYAALAAAPLPDADALAAGLSDPPRIIGSEPAARPDARPRTGAEQVPATATEGLVATVWREVLGRPDVGLTENFFEAGGDSLAIVAVQSRLGAVLDREIRVVDLFHLPTIRSYAAFLDNGSDTGAQDRAAERARMRRDAGRGRNAARRGARLTEKKDD
ncbi:mycobactin peptide synthetase MbtE [Catenulispora sp. EB89]|uniref:condensation domain-containing protein n=1 Tax=Catenulispora sp. EB89 TaxID=3156257 RepID=UPI0035129589